MKDYLGRIESYLQEEIDVMSKLDRNQINLAMNALEEARISGRTVYTCGNGGSASTASHFVCDFNKGISEKQKDKYNLVCLSDNIATMMAIANDISYDEIFRFQILEKIGKGDILIAISGSGNSENVVRAVDYAKEQGATVIGITGYSGGKIKEKCDISLHVPIDNMQIAEDVHLMFDHLMMYILADY